MSDVYNRTIFERGDIYQVDLDEYPYDPDKSNLDDSKPQKFMPTSGLIGKLRPCIIISDSSFNESNSGARIIPIKTPKEKDTAVKQYNDIIVPIEMTNGIHDAILSQARFVSRRRIKQYLCTITKSKLDEIDKNIVAMDLGISVEEVNTFWDLVKELKGEKH